MKKAQLEKLSHEEHKGLYIAYSPDLVVIGSSDALPVERTQVDDQRRMLVLMQPYGILAIQSEYVDKYKEIEKHEESTYLAHHLSSYDAAFVQSKIKARELIVYKDFAGLMAERTMKFILTGMRQDQREWSMTVRRLISGEGRDFS
jgi:hypothetical protein